MKLSGHQNEADQKKAKVNIIIPDIAGSDLLPGTQPSSTTASSCQIGTQSNKQVRPNIVDKSSSSNTADNADASIITGKDKPTTTELSSTDSQIGTLKNNVNKDVYDVNNIISDDITNGNSLLE